MDELKVGQKVVIGHHSGGWGRSDPYVFETVTKITKTQVTLSDDKRYLIRNGDEIGGGHYCDYIVRSYKTNNWMSVEDALNINKDIEQENNRKNLIRKLKDFDWRIITDEDLSVVDNVVERYSKEQ